VALVAHRPSLVETQLAFVVRSFQYELAVSEEDANLMHPHFFGHVFASQLSRVSPSETVDLLWASVQKPHLFCGCLEGASAIVWDDLLERLLEHVLSSSRNELIVVAILRKLSASSTSPSLNRLALAHRFRAAPLLFLRSPAISAAAIALAAASVQGHATEARKELAYLSHLLSTVIDTPNATSAMCEVAVAAIEGCCLKKKCFVLFCCANKHENTRSEGVGIATTMHSARYHNFFFFFKLILCFFVQTSVGIWFFA
jgi:hypothetical protein